MPPAPLAPAPLRLSAACAAPRSDWHLGGAEMAEKTGITLSMVLTAAAFKIVLGGFTPRISYLTYLDKYCLLSFFYMSAVAVQNLLSSSLFGPPHSPERYFANRISSVIIAGSWLLLHFFLPTWARALPPAGSPAAPVQLRGAGCDGPTPRRAGGQQEVGDERGDADARQLSGGSQGAACPDPLQIQIQIRISD